MKTIIVSLCILALATFAPGEDGQPVDHGKSLTQKLTEFHQQMADESVAVRTRALKSMLPAKADLDLILPKDSEILWPKLDAHYKSMVQQIDQISAQITKPSPNEIKAINVRESDDSGSYQQILKIIPKDIPVFRVVMTGKGVSSGSGSYLHVNDRWILLQGLEQLPEIAEQLRNE